MKPKTIFQCAKCPTEIQCWPHLAGKSLCRPCLLQLRSELGKRRCAGQTPAIGERCVRSVRKNKYEFEYFPSHPNAHKDGWVLYHRVVVERSIGRNLLEAEVVHHIDHNTLNNDISNLEIIESKGRHLADKHMRDAVVARIASYPVCACGKKTQHKYSECWSCWRKSQTCPVCNRGDRKMATRSMCAGCKKKSARQKHQNNPT